jgi:hypothetical protein
VSNRFAFACLCGSLLVLTAGCASGPRSTRVQPADVDRGLPAIKQSLAESSFITRRDGSSSQAILVALRPSNLSNERLSESDQRVPVSRVLLDPGILDLLRASNVRVSATPAERDRLVYWTTQSAGDSTGGWEDRALPPVRPEDWPTHGLKTEYRSRTRIASLSGNSPADARRDFFNVAYSIIDLKTGSVEWAGEFDVSRVGFGLLAD